MVSMLGVLDKGLKKVMGRNDPVPPPIYARPKKMRPRPGSSFTRDDKILEIIKEQEAWDKEQHQKLFNQPSFWEEMEDFLTTLGVATKCDWEIFYNTDQIEGLEEGWVTQCGHMAGPLQELLQLVDTRKDMAFQERGRNGGVTLDLITYHEVQRDAIEARGDDVAHYRV